MPRNGQGVYTLPPVYEAVTGETIEAQQHNIPLEDIASDANNPRPITTGGTGGASAQQARENLDVYSKAESIQAIGNVAAKETPVDADGVVIVDSADGNKPKKTLWSKIKALVNTASVGAAIAAANGKETPADGDFFAGVEAGGSTMFKSTWGNIKAVLAGIHYSKTEVNNIVAGNMAGRAYPRRSDGSAFNFVWNGQASNPAYVWGSSEPGTNAYPHPPAYLSVGWANGASYADRLGPSGWTLATVQDQLNWRVTDTRFDGFMGQELRTTSGTPSAGTGGSGYVVTSISKRNGVEVLDVQSRQPQRYIPNQGWRALGGW